MSDTTIDYRTTGLDKLILLALNESLFKDKAIDRDMYSKIQAKIKNNGKNYQS